MWHRLGLNIHENWIEEKQGIRRLITPNGVKKESESSLIFGRIQKEDDLETVAKSLSLPHVLKSFGNLKKAFEVYAPSVDFSTFKQKVEWAMARKVFTAWRRNKWNNDLPLWTPTLLRNALNSWPLAVEVGLARRKKGFKNLEDVSAFARNVCSIVPIPRGGAIVFADKKIYVSSDILNQDIWWEEWCGPCPEEVPPLSWSIEYVPFSETDGQKTGYVDPLLGQALQESMKGVLPSTIKDKLNIFKETLSPDQKDAVWMALRQLEKGDVFLLADETGYGKGRVLAAVSRVALNHDIPVLFVTEKKDLFSDFYRDCSAVFDLVPSFSLLHSQAKVFNSKGEKIPATNIKQLGKENWVWTTYSQFNRDNKEKTKSLLNWISKNKCWVILDEAHNASGQSNTFNTFKKFIEKSGGVLFSSATFAKQEQQLDLYKRMFSGSKQEWVKLRNSFSFSLGARAAVTLEWAENGKYLRRQHPPQTPPTPIWVSTNKENRLLFKNWARSLYILARVWGQIYRETPWQKIGATLSRAQREFSMLEKIPLLIEEVKKDRDLQRKTVIVSDWTFSSHASRLMGKEDSGDEEICSSVGLPVSVPLWKNAWALAMEEMFPENMCAHPKIKEAKSKMLQDLALCPNWLVSPFDAVIEELEKNNISTGEISGRNWRLALKDGVWRFENRDSNNRIKTIYDFNNSSLEVVLLTRAGNSGTSLHAGKSFSDQRVRHLIEWDISPDPSVRLQFWGRVRRKDQVCEPVLSTLLEDNLYERRRQSINSIKQQKIMAHGGNWVQNNSEHLWSVILAEEWSKMCPRAGHVVDPQKEYDLSKILSRAILLNEEDQDCLTLIATTGMDLLQNTNIHCKDFENPSRARQRMWWAGVGAGSLYWEERFWGMASSISKERVSEEIKKYSPKNDSVLQQGCGVSVIDPKTGQRVNAVVLGLGEPARSPALQKIHLWLVSWQSPLTTSLLAYEHPQLMGGKYLSRWADGSWFSAPSFPVKGLCLVGPAWRVASWGEKHCSSGELCRIIDADTGQPSWGWRMPQSIDFNKIENHRRELADVHHAIRFMREHPQASMDVVYGDQKDIFLSFQSDGVFMKASRDTWEERVSFPSRRLLKKISWSEHVTAIIPWSVVQKILHGFESQGGSFNVPPAYASWLKATWPSEGQ